MLKLFSGQDYPSNFHFACWDPEGLAAAFRAAGFAETSTEPFGREFSPGAIQLTAVKGEATDRRPVSSADAAAPWFG